MTKRVDPDDFRRALMLLDACEEALELAAAKEARQKPTIPGLREVTHQDRAKFVKRFVAQHSKWFER
jgi:hypothetical protein